MAEREQSLLLGLCIVVGDLAGSRSECMDAAAVMLEAAANLGLPLRAVPVVVSITDAAGTPHLVIAGEQVLRKLREAGVAGETPAGGGLAGRAGHVVLVSDEEGLLLDPSFRQVPPSVAEPVSLCLHVENTQPEDDFWGTFPTGRPGMLLSYGLTHEPEGLELVEQARPRYAGLGALVAQAVAGWVEAGADGEPPSLVVESPLGPRPATFADA